MSAEAQRPAAAFDPLVETLTDTRREIDELVERAGATRAAVASGVILSEFVGEEPRPLIITRMTELLDRMSDAAAEVRRAEAHQLRAEGLSHERIARLFGVTRQRAAALLALPPSPHAAPAAPRPRPKDTPAPRRLGAGLCPDEIVPRRTDPIRLPRRTIDVRI